MPTRTTLPVTIRGEQIGEISWVEDPIWETLPPETVWAAKLMWAVDALPKCWDGFQTSMEPQPKFLLVTRAIVEAINGGRRDEDRERDFQMLCLSHFGWGAVKGFFP